MDTFERYKFINVSNYICCGKEYLISTVTISGFRHSYREVGTTYVTILKVMSTVSCNLLYVENSAFTFQCTFIVMLLIS